ncbi:hypothetical protein ACWA7J_16845 [Leptothrix sp. BB-4]
MNLNPRLTRRMLAGLLLIGMGWLAGCSSTPTSKVLIQSEGPLAVRGVRIVFLERQFDFETTDPRFNAAYVSRTIQNLGKTFRTVLGDGLKTQGIESISTSAVLASGESEVPAAVEVWLRSEKPRWPVLFIIPNGARLQCAPCSLHASVQLQLTDEARIHWSASFRQPTFTGSLTLGEEAAQEQFAREVMRALSQQVRGPGKPA